MARFLPSLTLGAVLVLSAAYSSAQSVDISSLDAAQSFDTGPLSPSNGGLDPALWQGLSADRAQHYLAAIDGQELSELPSTFFRRVILSAGVPPQGDASQMAAFDQARTKAQLKLGDKLALDTLSNPQNPLQRDAVFRTQLALSSGDSEVACSEADREIDNRSAPFWMQMRITCHIMRDETAAAELTLNLLREQEGVDAHFTGLADHVLGLRKAAPENLPVGDPLLDTLGALKGGIGDEATPQSAASYAALALSEETLPNERLEALFKAKDRLSTDQVKSILSSLLFSNEDLAGGSSFDIDTALDGLQSDETWTKSVAQTYNLALNNTDPSASSQAVAALLNLSEAKDYVPQMSRHLSEVIAFIPAAQQAQLDAQRFAWAALRRGDLSTLASIYRELEGGTPLASRIALASDALGNGFVLGQLGIDIETRLGGEGDVRTHAVRDSLIALALGAQLSDKAALSLAGDETAERVNPLELAEINALAKSSARAGTLLKVVALIGERTPSDLSNLEIYNYISALSAAGLTREAGELAAFDFLSRVPKTE